jgi:hypothetical protein
MDDIRALFQELYFSKPNLKANLLLQVLALKADKIKDNIGNTTSLFNRLVPEIKDLLSSSAPQRIPHIKTSSEIRELAIKDFRIRRIRLSNVRGIPAPKNGLPFGFDLVSEEDDCRSAVLVGANGTGKSSIFSAIESLYVRDLSEPSLRYGHADAALYDRYLSNVDEPALRNIDIEVADPTQRHFTHASGKRVFEMAEFSALVNPDSSFVAEADIFKLSRFALSGDIDRDLQKDGIPLQSEIASLLGLASHLEASELLQAIQRGAKSRRAEKSTLNKLELSIKATEEEINHTQGDIQTKQADLGKEIDSASSTQHTGFQRIITELRKLTDPTRFDPSNLFRVGDELSAAIRESEGIAESASTKETVEFLQIGIELLAHADDCPMCLSSKKSRKEIEEVARTRLNKFQRLVELNKEVKRLETDLRYASEDLVSGLSQRLSQLEDEEKLLTGLPEFLQPMLAAAKLVADLRSLKDRTEQGRIRELIAGSKQADDIFRQDLKPLETSIKNAFKAWEDEREILNDSKRRFTERVQSISDPGIDPIQRKRLEIEQLNNKLADLKRKLSDDSRALGSAQAEFKALECIANGIAEIVEAFTLDFATQFESRFTPLKETVVSITESLFVSRGGAQEEMTFEFKDTVVDDSGLTRKTLELSVRTITGNKASPKYYLNAYRWKRLYSALSIAVAMAMRAKTRINLPLVIDDEILGADSSNRFEAVAFFERLLIEFRKRTPELPLQLIVFTQDEFLFDCIREGIDRAADAIEQQNGEDAMKGLAFDASWKKRLSDQTLFGRLFPPDDLEESPRQGVLSTDRYWCLVNEFPSRVLSLQKTIKEAVGL